MAPHPRDLTSIRRRRSSISALRSVGDFPQCSALPRKIGRWSLTTLRERLIKIGAKVIVHARYVTFQMAEVAVSRELFAQILDKIDRLRLVPDTG